MAARLPNLQRAFSLVELSVAAAIFSMGIGSLSIMMLAAIYGTAEARHQTFATTQADSLAEMIAMNSDASGHYINPPVSEVSACIDGVCATEDLAAWEMTFWQAQLQDGLPGGAGLACRDSTPEDGTAENPECDGGGTVVVKVFWEEARHRDSAVGSQRRVVSGLPW